MKFKSLILSIKILSKFKNNTNMVQPTINTTTTTEDPNIVWWNTRTPEQKVVFLDQMGHFDVRNDMGMLVEMTDSEKEAKIAELLPSLPNNLVKELVRLRYVE